MTTGAPVVAPRWTEQPAPPPAYGRMPVTPAARALMRTMKLSVEDLDLDHGAVVRLADVVSSKLKMEETATPAPMLAPAPSVVSDHQGLPPVSMARHDFPTSERVVVDAVLEGCVDLELRVARLLRAAAGTLRAAKAEEPVAASVTVLSANRHRTIDRRVVIADVWSFEPDALARRIANAQTSSVSPGPRLAVIDATQLDVRRLEPIAQAEVTVAVARPVARVMPLRTFEGAQVIALREVSEIVIVHDASISSALAARVATRSAQAFAAVGTS